MPRTEGLVGPACPGCGQTNDGHTQVNGPDAYQPQAGDLSVCAACGVISRYAGAGGLLALERLSAEALAALPMEFRVTVSRAQAAVMAVRALRAIDRIDRTGQ